MRTSKISQETGRLFNALSPNARTAGRSTRSAQRLGSFALGYNGEVVVKEEEEEFHASTTPDIEDALSPPPVVAASTNSRKRKLGAEPPRADAATTGQVTTKIKTEEQKVTWTSSRRRIKVEAKEDEEEEEDDKAETIGATGREKAKPKIPARRTTSLSGTVSVSPPSNWAEIYDTVKAMRRRNPTAPVDTMGCEDLYWRGAPPREKRYHTLTALMLSSQTKDTVTAAAMHRLHTELAEAKPSPSSSCLTVENMIACTPQHLDSLIGKVGFHNNKTKYIKQVATILKEQYDSDIPDTIEKLVKLPGVGPKMAYLCMSAAWGVDEGIGVDVHVHRITNLWGWHKTKTPEETRAWLEAWLPRDRWHEINKMLVGLGQTVCLPVGRRCGECDLAGTGLCKSEVRGWKAKPTSRTVKRETVKVEVKIEEGPKREEETIRTTEKEEEQEVKEEI
jgi:endonuclease-3